MPKEPGQPPERDFLARWSRRKADSVEQRRVAADAAAQPQSAGELSASPPDGAASPARAPEKILTDEHMPPVDSLTEDSDFSAFLSPGVSEELRKLALRKLFRSAVFNHRDGLDDYDDDFRNFPPLGDYITSDMKHQMEVDERRQREAQEAEAAAESQAQADSPTAPTEEAAPDEAPDGNDSEADEVSEKNPGRADDRTP